MKVVFDGTPFLLEKTGIGHYTENLIAHLLRSGIGLEAELFSISLRGGHRLKDVSPPLEGVTVKGFNLPGELSLLHLVEEEPMRSPPSHSWGGSISSRHQLPGPRPCARRAWSPPCTTSTSCVSRRMQSRGIRRFIAYLPELLERSRVVLADSRASPRTSCRRYTGCRPGKWRWSTRA